MGSGDHTFIRNGCKLSNGSIWLAYKCGTLHKIFEDATYFFGSVNICVLGQEAWRELQINPNQSRTYVKRFLLCDDLGENARVGSQYLDHGHKYKKLHHYHVNCEGSIWFQEEFHSEQHSRQLCCNKSGYRRPRWRTNCLYFSYTRRENMKSIL